MKMEESGKKLNNDKILKFENELNIQLPLDYKNFMLKNNGGIPKKDWAFDFVDTETNSITSSLITCFYVIYPEETDEDDDLRTIYQMHQEEEELPKDMLPIAEDPSGNVICMCVSKSNFGRIFFCDHELEDTETGYIVTYAIADSFSAFLDKLYEFNYEE